MKPDLYSPDSELKGIFRRIAKTVEYLVPVAISVLLVVWLFHKVNFADVVRTIKEGCNFWWVAAMMAITTLSHITRGVRWGIQLRGAGVPRMSVNKESISIFGAYALNLVFPRLGEVWRCVWVSRTERVPLTTVVGTDFGDRGSDAVMVLALFLLALVVAHPAIMQFLEHYSFGRELSAVLSDWWLWAAIVGGLALFWYVCHYWRRISWVAKMDGGLNKMWQGFKIIFTMRGRGLYVLLTFGIWLCYYMETYVMFQAFPFTRALVEEPGTAWGLVPGLVVFVFGSFSMAIPSNGGLGPWNVAVMFALSLYGISTTEGTAFSMVMWSCQAAWLVVLGLYSAVWVFLYKRHPRATKGLVTPRQAWADGTQPPATPTGAVKPAAAPAAPASPSAEPDHASGTVAHSGVEGAQGRKAQAETL